MTKTRYVLQLLTIFIFVSLVYIIMRSEQKQFEERMHGQDLQLQFSRRHGQ